MSLKSRLKVIAGLQSVLENDSEIDSVIASVLNQVKEAKQSPKLITVENLPKERDYD